MQIHARPLCAAALVMMMLSASGLFGQAATWLGDVQVAGQDTLSSGNPALASSVGMGPDRQALTGTVQLDLHGRLSYSQGQLSFADTAAWWQGSDGGTLQNDLQQAWVSVTPDPSVTVVLGKQRLPWGTGYAFFPGDRINPPVNPQNRAEGFYGVSATFAPSASFSLTACVRVDAALTALSQLPGLSYSTGTDAAASLPFLAAYVPSAPSDPWRSLRYALYAEAFLEGLDLHAAMTWQLDQVLRPTAGFSVDLLGFILDGAVAVELSNGDLYPQSDGSYSAPGFGKAYPLATLGLQRTAATESATFAATLEYLYDGTGYDPGQEKQFLGNLLSALGAGPGSPLSVGSAASSAWFSSGDVVPALGRHYGALSLSASINRRFSTDAALIVNLQDQSLALQGDFAVTSLEGIDLFVRAIAGGGPSSRTEFGSLPVRLVASAGATVHF